MTDLTEGRWLVRQPWGELEIVDISDGMFRQMSDTNGRSICIDVDDAPPFEPLIQLTDLVLEAVAAMGPLR